MYSRYHYIDNGFIVFLHLNLPSKAGWAGAFGRRSRPWLREREGPRGRFTDGRELVPGQPER